MDEGYTYDPALSFATNRERALAFHQKNGPMVPVIAGADGDQMTTHWLFASGATITRDPLELPRLPGEGMRPGNCHPRVLDEALRQRLANRVEYWSIRLRQAEVTFKAAKKRYADSPTEEEVAFVKGWRDEVFVCRTMKAAAELTLNPPPPEEQLTQEQQDRLRRENGERQALEDRVAAMTI